MNGVNGAVSLVKDLKNFAERVSKQGQRKLFERVNTVEKLIVNGKKKNSERNECVRTTAKWIIGLFGPNGLVRKEKDGCRWRTQGTEIEPRGF